MYCDAFYDAKSFNIKLQIKSSRLPRIHKRRSAEFSVDLLIEDSRTSSDIFLNKIVSVGLTENHLAKKNCEFETVPKSPKLADFDQTNILS